MTTALIACIRFYQRITRGLAAIGFGPFARAGCRQWPTCSEYGIAEITRLGAGRGLVRALVRVAHCHPFA